MTPPANSAGDGDGSKLVFLLGHIEALRDETQLQHRRLREDFDKRIECARAEAARLRADLTEVTLDLTALKTQHSLEKDYGSRRAVIIGTVAGMVVSVLMWLGDKLWK